MNVKMQGDVTQLQPIKLFIFFSLLLLVTVLHHTWLGYLCTFLL